MKKVLILVIFIAASVSLCRAASSTLKFHDGTFKIAQFTDPHMDSGNAGKVIDMMTEVVKRENPDLIVLTGDNVLDGGDDASKTARWKQLCDVLESTGIPYAIVLGNHDAELFPSAGRKGIYDLIREFGPHCINTDYVEGLTGCGVKDIPIYSADGNAVKSLIYCMDSNDYPPVKRHKSHSWYDWMHFDQIAWYRETSAKYTEANGGKPLPAVAFFHICVPEYETVVARKAYLGHAYESCCPPSMNSGFFLSAFEMGDIMAMFVGHDHENDFCGMYKGIALCYGRQSGVLQERFEEMPLGGRIIVLKEGERDFNTWTADIKGKGPVWNYPSGMYIAGITHFDPAIEAKVAGNGVAYRFYKGTQADIDNGTLFTKKNLKSKGVMNNFIIPTDRKEDFFGYEFDTYVMIPEESQYDINFNVNEGAIIYLDGKRLSGNPGDPIPDGHQSSYVCWEKGLHHIQARYYEETGRQKFEVDIRPAAGSSFTPADSILFAPKKPDFNIK